MDRTADFFRVRKFRLPWTGLLHERMMTWGMCMLGMGDLLVWIKEEMEMTKRKLALAVALATVGSVWMGVASAAEETSVRGGGDTRQL